jgi:hypothetical protein
MLPTNKAKVSAFFFLSLISIFFFQRFKQKVKREQFLQKLEMKEVFSLFHKIMRVYHDGMLLTNDKEVVFKNRLLAKLLKLDSPQTGF